MDLSIKIMNGEVILFNGDQSIFNIELDKDILKKKILQVIENKSSPIKVRDVIYNSLYLLSGYQVKKSCKIVNKQEANDPLYKELSDFILNSDKYQKLIQSSRSLQILNEEFVISDINGIVCVKSNDEIDLTQIISELYTLSLNPDMRIKSTLKSLLMKYFDVNSCALNYSNPLIMDLYQKLLLLKYPKQFLFRDGKIYVRVRNNYFPPEPHITVEALKKEIIVYIRKNPKQVKKSEIIFNSLELLTGCSVVRKATSYVPMYVGKNKIRKDKLIEDPLYAELCKFIDTIPEFQENRKISSEIIRARNEALNSSKIDEREKRFVERNCMFNEKYIRNFYPPIINR